ncbi:peptidase domain-containing ABC transporter [Serratia sp. NPDC078593]|uniref:peptidase domain-containing ABC transporter n=1 Tax=unclassified Serratia (in: enterobacteria) TaxID=2647522 RepID=UPI0037D03C44
MSNDVFGFISQKLSFGLIKRVPQILQTETSECSLACLAMICGYYGLNIDLYNLRHKFSVSSQGATLNTLVQASTMVNLNSRALTLDLDEIKELKLPCILHWDMSHFVVLVAVRRSSFVIHDPASGKRVIGIKEMSQHFTGVALELWPNSQFTKATLKSKVKLLDLVKSISGIKGILTKIFFLSVVIETVNLLLPVGTQLVTDHVIQAKDNNLLSVICIGLLFFLIFHAFISMIRGWISLVTGSMIDLQWKASFFDHLMRLPLSFFEKRHLGDIQSRFSSLEVIRNTFTNNIIGGLIDGIMTIGLIVMMFFYGDWLSWVVIGFTVCYAFIRIVTYDFYRRMTEEKIVKDAKANSHFMETLYGISAIKALGLHKRRSGFWLNLNVDATNTNIRLTRFNMMVGGLNTFISSLDQITILWLGALMVIDNNMSLGMFIAFNAYRGQFSQRSASLVDLLLQLRVLSLHNERISDIAFTDPEPEVPLRKIFESEQPVSFEIKELSYQYDGAPKPVFDKLSFRVEAGSSVAIVGPSGIGKTTLLKVMAGLLSPTQGTVQIEGMDIHKIGLDNYRECISCVLQDDKLFSGSIADNISGFDLTPDYDLIVSCSTYCNMHDEIMKMSMGYETLIGELGSGLSGGQKQRLLIARALYRKPNIIFMDEATSHLDLDNESIINKSISDLNVTRIIVAHRPSTIASAERVINLAEAAAPTP